MNKKAAFLSLFAQFFALSLVGMNKRPIAPSIEFITNVSTSKTSGSDFPYIARDIFNNEKYTSFACGSFAYNADSIIKAMNNAVTEDAQVHLIVGPHACNKMNLYTVTTAQRDPNAHLKVVVGLTDSPSKKIPTEGTVLLGSANLTNQTWKNNIQASSIRHNCETGLLIKDAQLAKQAYQMVKSDSPMKPDNKKRSIQITPTKPTIVSSKHTRLNKSWRLRLDSLATNTSKNRSALIRTMNVNDEPLIDSSIAAQKSGARIEWIVNHTTLTSNGIPLLKKLTAANVNVHVYYPTEGSRSIQHAKDIIIKKGKKSTYINSNGNFTNEGDDQLNLAAIIPNDNTIITDATNDFNNVKSKCISLKKALKLKKQDIKKAKKRKAEALEKKKPAKKKKAA